jgi:hypothetical protein
MATHGPCETEGPDLLPYLVQSGIEDITAGIRPRSARPARRRHGEYTKAGAAGTARR